MFVVVSSAVRVVVTGTMMQHTCKQDELPLLYIAWSVCWPQLILILCHG